MDLRRSTGPFAIAWLSVILATFALGLWRVSPGGSSASSPSLAPAASVSAMPAPLSPSPGGPVAPATISPAPTTQPKQTPASSAAPTASPSASASPSPVATLVPIGFRIGQEASKITDAALQAGLALLVLLVIVPLGSILLWLLAKRVIALTTRRQLVVDDLIDATGDDGIKSAASGLSQELRERLYYELQALLRLVHAMRTAHGVGKPVDAPPPRKSADPGLAELITAVKDSAPEQAKGVLALLGALLPAAGRRVTGVLQRSGMPPYRLGLSAEIADMEAPERSELHSLRGSEPLHQELSGALPSTPSPEARSLTAVARRYEGAGRWAEAQAKYEAALEKAPDYDSALAGLSRTLAEPDLRTRAEGFVHLAAKWLAILLFEARWLEHPTAGEGGSAEEEEARIHNFVGVRLAYLAESPLADQVWLYSAALESFRLSQRHLPGWYLPYENEADVTSYFGVATDSDLYQRRAVRLYDEALQRVSHPGGSLSDESLTGDRIHELSVEIRVSRAIALLLQGLTEAAYGDLSEALGPQWIPDLEPSADVLYAVACFRARALELGADASPENILLCLAWAFARDPRLVEESRNDPDLTSIRSLVEALAGAADWEGISALDEVSTVAMVIAALSRVLGIN